MIDIFHILNQPGIDVQTYVGTASVSLTQWQTWKKPRGATWIYMMGIGGGASGGCGLNSAATSGGGGGGGSGSQTSLLIPAFLVPDVLYIQAGQGGKQPAVLVSAAAGVAGIVTLVAAEPYTSTNAFLTYLFANPGSGSAAATTTTGGGGGAAGSAATISNMNLASRGVINLLAGQAGSAGGASTAAGAASTFPTTGLTSGGGTGGGGTDGTTARAGGSITLASGLGQGWWPTTISGGAAASGATPATVGQSGYIAQLLNIRTGGAGGGSASGTSGGVAGGGGNGAPGSGGGGAGGSSTTGTNTTLARPGDGGDGLVIMVAF